MDKEMIFMDQSTHIAKCSVLIMDKVTKTVEQSMVIMDKVITFMDTYMALGKAIPVVLSSQCRIENRCKGNG